MYVGFDNFEGHLWKPGKKNSRKLKSVYIKYIQTKYWDSC